MRYRDGSMHFVPGRAWPGARPPRSRRPHGGGARRAVGAAAAIVAAASVAVGCSSDITGSATGAGPTETSVPPLQARAASPTSETSTAHTAPPASGDGTATHPAAPETGDAGGTTGDLRDCRTDELDVALGREGGALGSTYQAIVFTNTSNTPCTLEGFPGVSYVDASGEQVGASADRDPVAPSTVTLAPGESASANVREVVVQNFPADACRPVDVSGLKVYPPNNTAAVVLDHSGTGCSSHDPDQLSVRPVVPGTDG